MANGTGACVSILGQDIQRPLTEPERKKARLFRAGFLCGSNRVATPPAGIEVEQLVSCAIYIRQNCGSDAIFAAMVDPGCSSCPIPPWP